MAPLATAIKFLLVLVLTFSAHADTQESKLSRVKKTETLISRKIINNVDYMPPMIIIGKKDGSIIRCPHATPTDCEVYHSGNSAVTATLVHGEFLFAALESGAMLRCSWQRRHSCSVFNQVDSTIIGLAVAAGYIHTGLQNGTILRCQLDAPHSCHRFAHVDRSIITSLAAFGSFLYVGSADARIDRCSLNSGQCSIFCQREGTKVTGLALFGERIYAGRDGGALQYCDIEGQLSDDYTTPGAAYYDIVIYNRQLYIGKPTGIFVHDLDSRNTKLFVEHTDGLSLSISHGTYAVQAKYQMESQKCIWKGVFACPPTVVYYRIQDRAPMEVSIEGGKLYDSEGVIIDTTDADEINSQKAAMFVMGPDGQILLSKVHKTGLLHTSSLLAGNPVAGAGLIVVENGKIRNITACSVHYRPDPELNNQVKESLYQRGYTDSFDSLPCNYISTGSCDIDDTSFNNMY